MSFSYYFIFCVLAKNKRIRKRHLLDNQNNANLLTKIYFPVIFLLAIKLNSICNLREHLSSLFRFRPQNKQSCGFKIRFFFSQQCLVNIALKQYHLYYSRKRLNERPQERLQRPQERPILLVKFFFAFLGYLPFFPFGDFTMSSSFAILTRRCPIFRSFSSRVLFVGKGCCCFVGVNVGANFFLAVMWR